jgi:4-hydroxybenzoate polyprenyltransferase
MSKNISLDFATKLKRDLSEIFLEIENYLKKIFLFLTISSIFTGISGFCMTYTGYILLGINPNISICIAVFLMVFSVYALDKITDSDEDAINMPERGAFLANRKKLVKGCAISAYALSALIVFHDNPLSLTIILFPIAANAVYGTRLHPSIPRLKDIPVMKNLVVSFSWALATALLPAVHMVSAEFWLVALIFYFMLVKDFINTVLYDIRDTEGDRVNGVRTIPVILGEKRTTSILLALNTTFLPWLTLVPSSIKPFALALIIYGYFYILFFQKRRNPIMLDLLVDGEWVIASTVFLMMCRIV